MERKYYEIEFDNDVRCRDFADSDETIGDYSICIIGERKPTYEEAIKMLNDYLEEEIKTVENEQEYTPSVIKDSEDDVTLIYAEGFTENYHTEDYACYRIFEVEV